MVYLEYVQNNAPIILGNKVINIPLLFQYNFDYDILPENDFNFLKSLLDLS